MLGSFGIHHSRVACCQVSKDRNLIVYLYSAAQMMNPLKFVALLGAALWLFAGANIFRVVVGDRRSRVCQFFWPFDPIFRNWLHAVSLSESRNKIRGARPGQKDPTSSRIFQTIQQRESNSKPFWVFGHPCENCWDWRKSRKRGELAFWLLPNWFHDVVITLTTVGIIALATVGI